jgi:hypothetical protein
MIERFFWIPFALFSSYEAFRGSIMAVYASDPAAGLPKLIPNYTRILEAILYVIECAERGGAPATQYEIAKTLFLADLRHLEGFGRPITFDNYTAMKDGPVPSASYNMLKPDFNWQSLGEEGPLWVRRKAQRGGPRAFEYVRPARSANRNKLSETDLRELSSALSQVQKMGFHGTRDYTHRIPAYKEAWEARGSNDAKEMDLRALLPAFDQEMIENLEHASRHA